MRYYSTTRNYNANAAATWVPDDLMKEWNKRLRKSIKEEKYDRFVSEIADLPYNELMKGKCFHEQDWVKVKGYPRNGLTDHEFMGGENAVYCMVAQHVRGYREPVWLQYRMINTESVRRAKEAAKTGIEQPFIFVAEKDNIIYLNSYSKNKDEMQRVSMYNIEQVVNPPEMKKYPEPLLYITKDREKLLDAHLENMASDLGVKITHSEYFSESKYDSEKNVLEMPPKDKYREPEAYYCGAFYELSLRALQVVEKTEEKCGALSAEISTILLCHKYGVPVNLDEKKLKIRNACMDVVPVMKRMKVWYTSILHDGGRAADYIINHKLEIARRRDVKKNFSSFELQNLMPNQKEKKGSERHV